MISKLFIIETKSTDPYHNLALEKYLFDELKDGECYLYLWQNANTVVIGYNQNPYNECDLEAMEKDRVQLARRLSGGGAVYHDLGNVNFTFICRSADFDEKKQTSIILNALNSLGIEAEKSGRNDLLLEGRKFSGHAYYHHNRTSYHHGTLMLDVNMEKLQKYLNVSKLKLNDKHVKSVRSRVINLREIKSGLMIADLNDAMKKAFEGFYGIKPSVIDEASLDQEKLEELREHFADEQYLLGKQKHLPLVKEDRFPWGTVRIEYELDSDLIRDIDIYSDCLHVDHLSEIPKLIKGHRLAELDGLFDDEEFSQIDEDIRKLLTD
ncbi:MAG: lipoate--protein ligase [Erysipelotrichaceae bacterium]|nr:lipoate--protein ligase [Erysipelotrichaceae bacterium]